ncbi:hypothetical protein NPIL_201441 [Nephila pilipes]|uniref:Uncharacterized protein n=1 Tax=Nephila pilipes TaxID=299642 RepID=A0A8X6NAQ0_NEPPI|nr:hypothetical protein NPIL_201441 [Nephila pilipes]
MEGKKNPWRYLDYFKNPDGQQKKMARYHYSGNIQKVNYDKMQKPIPAKRFKYLIKNSAQSQLTGMSHSQNHFGGRKPYSKPERLKPWGKLFRNTAANFYAPKRHPRFREQPKHFDLIKQSNPPRFIIRSSKPTLTTVPPLTQPITSNSSTNGYFILSGMFLLLLACFFHYWWNRKNKKAPIEYLQIPPLRLVVDDDQYSIQSEIFSIPSSPTFETEPKTEASVILNFSEMDKLPKINVLAYNGFKSTPTLEKQTTEKISDLFSEGDFVRHYLTETSTTHLSTSEQESTLSHLSPETRPKIHSIGVRNPADFSSSQSSEQECPNFPQFLRNALSSSSAREQESDQTASFETWNSKNISLNSPRRLPDLEHTFSQRVPHQGRSLSYPNLNLHSNEVNPRIPHSDPCLPCSTNEESDPVDSSEDSSSSSSFTTATIIPASVKVPPPANPAPSAKNLKRLLFPSSSSSDSETGEEEIIILHTSQCPLGKVQRIRKI